MDNTKPNKFNYIASEVHRYFRQEEIVERRLQECFPQFDNNVLKELVHEIVTYLNKIGDFELVSLVFRFENSDSRREVGAEKKVMEDLKRSVSTIDFSEIKPKDSCKEEKNGKKRLQVGLFSFTSVCSVRRSVDRGLDRDLHIPSELEFVLKIPEPRASHIFHPNDVDDKNEQQHFRGLSNKILLVENEKSLLVFNRRNFYHRNIACVLRVFDGITFKPTDDFVKIWKKKYKYGPPDADSLTKEGSSFDAQLMVRHSMDFTSYIEIRKRLEVEFTALEICNIMKGLLEGLEYLHDKNYVHRDLHDGNVFVDPIYGNLKIGDFGHCICFKLNNPPFVLDIEKTDDVLFNYGGCVTTQVPEVVDANDNKGKKVKIDYSTCDIYSVGCILYGLIVLEMPSVYMITEEKLRKMDNLTHVPGSLVKLCKNMLKKDQSKRIGVKEALRELEEVMNDYRQKDLKKLLETSTQNMEDASNAQNRVWILKKEGTEIKGKDEDEEDEGECEEDETTKDDQVRKLPVIQPKPQKRLVCDERFSKIERILSTLSKEQPRNRDSIISEINILRKVYQRGIREYDEEIHYSLTEIERRLGLFRIV